MNQWQYIAMVEISITVIIVINIIIIAIIMSLIELNESGTIEAKELIEIVGNLCELEGVAKVKM